MAFSLESVAIAIHCCFSSISLIISGLLVFAVFRHTPPVFCAFGIMLKFHALVDFYAAIGYSACLQRAIAIDKSIILMSYGPVEYFGPTACWIACTMLMGGSSCVLYNNVASFIFRLLVVRGNHPTSKDAIKLICFVSLPVTIVTSIAFIMARGDDSYFRELMNAKLPDYEADLYTVTGVVDVNAFVVKMYLYPVMMQVWPLYTAVLILRSLILSRIEQREHVLSHKSKRLQKKFVTMLTAQAAVPIVQGFAVTPLILGYCEIARLPVLEISSNLIGESVGFLSPSIVLFSIDHYRRAVQGLFLKKGNERTSVTTISISISHSN